MKRICALLLTILLTAVMAVPLHAFAEPEGEQGETSAPSEQTGGQDQSSSGSAQEQSNSAGTQGQESQKSGGQGQSSSGSTQDQGSLGSAEGQGGSQEGTGNGGHSDSQSQSTDNNTQTEKKDDNSTGNDIAGQGNGAGQKKKTTTDQKKGEISFIFTGDIHSHLDGIDGSGGFPRLKTQIDEIKEKYPESFTFDAGDFSMGTAFQTIFRTEASELRMMGELDYDAVTFGNHDFDYGLEGTAKMLDSAAKEKDIKKTEKTEVDETTRKTTKVTTYDQFMPDIVSANIDWKATFADESRAKDTKKLKKAMDDYGVSDYSIVERNGVKVAVFGLMGKDAQAQSPYSGLKWSDPVKRAEDIVAEIERNGEADMIVCLSHCGYSEEESRSSEDVKLAKSVPGIDVIISGHEHTALTKPVTVGDTYIVAAGNYTEHVGNIVLKKQNDRFALKSYMLYGLGGRVEKDQEIQAKVDDFKDKINEKYFSKYGLSYSQVLTRNDYAFPTLEEFERDRQDNALGNIVSDSFVYAVKEAEGKSYEHVDAAIVPSSALHGSIAKGTVTTSELFSVCSMGVGDDGKAGHPLVSGYITGKELKRVAEIDASVAKSAPGAILNVSGMSY